MRLVGLTGGIGSGKSTASEMFRSLGATVLDADQLARAVVMPGQPGLAEVSRRFPGVVDEAGQLDRAALARRIFSDDGERAALNAILHPLIQSEMVKRTNALAAQGVHTVLYDAALLIENGMHLAMDGGVILVWVPPELQRSRLMVRDGLSPQDAEARIAAQAPLDAKRPLATWVLDNSGSREQTRAQVGAIWKALGNGAG